MLSWLLLGGLRLWPLIGSLPEDFGYPVHWLISLVSSCLSLSVCVFFCFSIVVWPSLLWRHTWQGLCCQREHGLGHFLIFSYLNKGTEQFSLTLGMLSLHSLALTLHYIFGNRDICMVICHRFRNFDVLFKGTSKTHKEESHWMKVYWFVIYVNVCVFVVQIVRERIKLAMLLGRYKANYCLISKWATKGQHNNCLYYVKRHPGLWKVVKKYSKECEIFRYYTLLNQ